MLLASSNSIEPHPLEPLVPVDTSAKSLDFDEGPIYDMDVEDDSSTFFIDPSTSDAFEDFERPFIVKKTDVLGNAIHKEAGSTLRLECFVGGRPTPTIMWYKVSEEIQSLYQFFHPPKL